MSTAETRPGFPGAPHFLVGRDRSGQWVARDQNGRCGGLFKTRDEAFRFACHERGDGPGAVILVSGILELFDAATDRSVTGVGSSNEASAVARRNPLEV